MHYGRRPFGVLNSVLVQNLSRFCLKKRTKKHRQKRHKNLFYSKTPSYKKNNIKIAWPNNCVKLPRDFHSLNVNIADDLLQFCPNFGNLENHVKYEGAFLDISKSE